MIEEEIEIEVLPLSERNNRVSIDMFFEDMENLKGFIPKKLGDFIKEEYVFKTLNDTGETYVYQDGIYVPGNFIIKSKVRNVLSELTKNYHVSETIGHIRDTTFIDRSEVNSESSKIPLENGVLDLNTLEVIPHDPDYFFTFKLPVEYHPEKKCDFFLEWLRERLEITDEDDKNDWKLETLQEYFGYCLLKDIRFQKALMLIGKEGTGKSTLLAVIQTILGEDNTNSMPLQHITANTFASAYLHDKIANICPDLDTNSLSNVGKFLSLTGDKFTTNAIKGGHETTFRNICKLIFSCNKLPRTPRKGLEFYRRWILIPFDNIIDSDEKKPGFEEFLLEERDGIFGWMVEGLKRLLDNKEFKSYPYTKHDIKLMWEKNSNSIDAFIEERIEMTDYQSSITKRETYQKYKEYCKENELIIENNILFGKVFLNTTGCGTGKKDQLPCYVGVNFKDSLNEQTKLG